MRETAEAIMERMQFTCPNTGAQITVAIESDLGTLLRIRLKTVRQKCPACGNWHEWLVRDAMLVRAA